METMEKAITSAIIKLMRPLVRILLRNGIPFRTFAELAKQPARRQRQQPTAGNRGRGITCLFVVEGPRPVGLIHIHDCLRVGLG